MKNLIYVLGVALMLFTSCGKDKEYENGEVIMDSFSGSVQVTSGGEDPAGDFTGNGDSGIYEFAWKNNQRIASANFDITTSTGSVQMIIRDANCEVVLDKTRIAGGNDTYSGVSSSGEPGIWKVRIVFTDFNGDGSYSLHPGD